MRTFQQLRGNLVQLRRNFVATSSQIYTRIVYQDFMLGFYTRVHHVKNPKLFWQTFWPWDTTGQKSTKNRQTFGNLFSIIGPQTRSIHAFIPIIGCGIFRRFLVKWSQGPYGPPENQTSQKTGSVLGAIFGSIFRDFGKLPKMSQMAPGPPQTDLKIGFAS